MFEAIKFDPHKNRAEWLTPDGNKVMVYWPTIYPYIGFDTTNGVSWYSCVVTPMGAEVYYKLHEKGFDSDVFRRLQSESARRRVLWWKKKRAGDEALRIVQRMKYKSGC